MSELKAAGILFGIILSVLITGWVLELVTQNVVGFLAIIVLVAGVLSVMLWRGVEDL